MVNDRDADLGGLVNVVRAEVGNVLENVDNAEYRKFAWVIDPEGNTVELWEPPTGQ